jgi:hypothetical protein
VSALSAGLYSIGIPKDSVIEYETAIKTDKYLLVVHGTASQVEKAKEILSSTRPLNLNVHGAELVGASGR